MLGPLDVHVEVAEQAMPELNVGKRQVFAGKAGKRLKPCLRNVEEPVEGAEAAGDGNGIAL